MAFNLKNANDVHLGTGVLYVNGTDVGLLKGNVTFSYAPEYQEITGGSPEQLVKKSLISESATLTAGMMEINLSTIGSIMPIFTPENTGTDTASAVKEYLGPMYAGTWQGAENAFWTEGGTVELFLASPLSAIATAGATKIYVEDASLFSPSDVVVLTDGATTEEVTIAALGVDTTENSLTVSALDNSYGITGYAHNKTVSLVDGTDYFINRINGQVTIISDSSLISDGDTASVSYVHHVYATQGLYAGGQASTDTYPVRFESERADGKKFVIEFYKAQIAGEFSMEFNPSDAMVLNVEISAVADSSKEAGKQLFSIKTQAA